MTMGHGYYKQVEQSREQEKETSMILIRVHYFLIKEKDCEVKDENSFYMGERNNKLEDLPFLLLLSSVFC
jgi:hypothetical protein